MPSSRSARARSGSAASMRPQFCLRCRHGRAWGSRLAPFQQIVRERRPWHACRHHWRRTCYRRPLRHGATAPPASRAIIYVVRVQTLVGNMRLSKKRPLASLTTPGCVLRLFVEALDIGLDEDGNPVGNGAKAQPAGLYGGYGSPAHMTDEDRHILRRLQMRIGDTDHEGCQTGAGGADLFERILAAGRARWATARGVSMHRQVSRKASSNSPRSSSALPRA